jgi:hypothetical protein
MSFDLNFSRYFSYLSFRVESNQDKGAPEGGGREEVGGECANGGIHHSDEMTTSVMTWHGMAHSSTETFLISLQLRQSLVYVFVVVVCVPPHGIPSSCAPIPQCFRVEGGTP